MAQVTVTLNLDGEGIEHSKLEENLRDFIENEVGDSIEVLDSCSIDISEEA
jgi:hypothetical protein